MVRQPSINAQHRPPLSIERIIEAALQIIDGQGLGRLTMRRLGDALEVEAMAIYHHLPRGKEQLLDGLVEHVAAVPAETHSSASWHRALREWAGAYRERLLAHAGVLPLVVTRRNPVALVPTAASIQELLRQGGVTEAKAAVAAHTLLGYVIGHAALEVRGTAEGVPPLPEGPVDWDARFVAGLDLVLAGVAAR
ncbi:TetR/AcrR family transcriptional regulator C-terminal domain-containing protein [Actinomadura xylanilytica]|uniref:TetR/AcrR family transcriptional regulator C-terminal domain-containing protein n=1 Tax=Actinomadura xylanilytica TaxID=887459 RepID=UPI00255AF4AE|nr:TetR/AcrR family transcriptional regulator C-terminal domain-containing protein [Actinomadura xylanilytica]MDL4776583.1 TetR/AcrR family transcriptional regulator C-terminal domain-containing protein [Actinomadura xylanilytica]